TRLVAYPKHVTDINTSTPQHLNTFFCEVLLPVPIPQLFTYRVPQDLNESIQKGQRVIVQFGDRKIMTGIVMTIHHSPPKDHEAKSILELLDHYPAVSDKQIELYAWIADYYLCTMGEVMNAGLPSGLKLSSESMVQLQPSFNLDESDQPFSEKELIVLKHLQTEAMSYTDIANLLGIRSIYSIIKSLVGKDAVILFEEVKEKYKPKTERRVRLTAENAQADVLQKLFETLSAKPKQEAVLLKYLQAVPVMHDPATNKQGM